MPEFYNNEYDLEFNQDNSKIHINKYIKIAAKRNEQANGTIYASYSWNPFDIIRNIIDIDNIQLTDNASIVETLVNKAQQIDAKISAISLLIYLRSKFSKYHLWANLVNELIGNVEDILSAKTDFMITKSSLNSLEFNLMLMKLGFNCCTFEEATIGFASAMNYGEYDFITIMKSLELFLSTYQIKKLNKNILGIIINFILSVGTEKHKDAQYYAAKSLILLSKINFYKTVSLERLAYIMNEGISDIKISILRNIKDSKLKNKGIENFILQKGRTDNHYLVRKLAEEITKSIK